MSNVTETAPRAKRLALSAAELSRTDPPLYGELFDEADLFDEYWFVFLDKFRYSEAELEEMSRYYGEGN